MGWAVAISEGSANEEVFGVLCGDEDFNLIDGVLVCEDNDIYGL